MSMPSANGSEHIHDLIIVGAGAVGLTLARALGSQGLGLDIALVSAAPLARPKAEAPGRAYALGAGSCRMLDGLEVWSDLKLHAQSMDRIIVTDGQVGGSELSLLEFDDSETVGGPAYLVEEPALLAGLHDAVVGSAGLDPIIGNVTGYSHRGRIASVHFAGRDDLRANLVVAADGARSVLRTQARIGLVAWDYGQAGLVCTIHHDRPHEGVAIERFYPTGPFAMLPLGGQRTSLVWTESEPEAQRLANIDPQALETELGCRFGDDRGQITQIGPRRAYPLKFQIARNFTTDRLVLTGDAAHVVHPLAGQGLNLGLRDVGALAECIADTARLGLDIGDAVTLQRYERWRRFDTVQLALGFDGLNRLFSNDHDGLRLARDLGLGVVQRLPPLRRYFMREAAGTSGEMPRLFAGQAL